MKFRTYFHLEKSTEPHILVDLVEADKFGQVQYVQKFYYNS